MKKLNILAYGLITLFFISCSNDPDANSPNSVNNQNENLSTSKNLDNQGKEEANTIDYNKVIGYVDDKGNAILLLDKAKIIESYKQYSEDDYDFNQVQFVTLTDNNKTIYNLKISSDNFKASILVKNVQGYLRLFGTKCESISCSTNYGCNALEARCSACSGDCKKTSTSGDAILWFMPTLEKIYPIYYESYINQLKNLKV